MGLPPAGVTERPWTQAELPPGGLAASGPRGERQTMADSPEHLAEGAGTQPADEDWSSFATVPLDKVGEALDFVLWKIPAHMIPTPERACEFIAELMAGGGDCRRPGPSRCWWATPSSYRRSRRARRSGRWRSGWARLLSPSRGGSGRAGSARRPRSWRRRAPAWRWAATRQRAWCIGTTRGRPRRPPFPTL